MPGKWTRQKFNCVYQMVDPHKKNEIIHDINRGIINTNVKSGIKSNWWTNKHHPNKLIPSRIYELGSGTLEELEQRYFDKYEKRKGVWKFSKRVVDADWVYVNEPSEVNLEHPMIQGANIGTSDPTDPLYLHLKSFKRGLRT